MTAGILSLLLANFVGGAILPMFIKLGVGQVPPITFTLLRFVLASLIILPVYLRHRGPKLSVGNIKWVLLDCVCFSANVVLYSIGIQYTHVIIAQILYAFVPVIVAFLSYFMLKEKITRYEIVGSVIAFLGLLFLLSQSFGEEQGIFGKPLGNLIIMVGVISWSFYFILSRKIAHFYSQISISFANFLTSAVLLAFFTPFELILRPFSVLNISSLGLISLIIVSIVSVAFIILLQEGIKRTGAFIASLFTYIGPLFVAMTAVPFLGEKVTLNLVLGGLLILFGVFYATTYSRLQKSVRLKI